nr:hypothetical protein [Bacillus pumilus]
MQQTEKIIQSLHSITKWGKVGSIFLYISGGLAILIGFWLVLPVCPWRLPHYDGNPCTKICKRKLNN